MGTTQPLSWEADNVSKEDKMGIYIHTHTFHNQNEKRTLLEFMYSIGHFNMGLVAGNAVETCLFPVFQVFLSIPRFKEYFTFGLC